MLQTLKDHLSQKKEIFQWQIRQVEKKSHELYLIHQTRENRRQTWKRQYEITLFSRNDSGMGEASFVVLEGSPSTQIQKKVDLALQAAQMIQNPFFELPEAESFYPKMDLYDKKTLQNPETSLQAIEEDLFEQVNALPHVKLASSEIYLNHDQVTLVNSSGLKAQKETSRIHLDFVLLSGSGLEEVEALCYYERRHLEDLNLSHHVKQFSHYVTDSLRAELPTSGHYDVVFGEEALDTLFDFFTYQCSAEANYSQKAKVRPQDAIISKIPNPKDSDLLTLHSNAILPKAIGSSPFDHYGSKNRKTLLIKDHVYQKLWGSSKYAQYENIPVTGSLGNIQVEPGKKTAQELLLPDEKPLFHLLRFSTFSPNRVTGSFSGEIRTGYRIDPDGTRTPIRGGAISGSLIPAFEKVRFSKETALKEHYQGPEAIRFSDLQISGKEG